ncbi:dethiobiotin synthetase [Reichenbachiella faecimaris]|uniref:ATP-dependent dethiobiotin synthetase BioD n=1 Tax=Reichenbachiella faecimaris TaxID=692418 RepID=A0A1W2GL09_REIFA|nr:dethiobiotin synthase [Reichenbachiella faecimaris]SMD37038.1 dethiobiotin synthetase [Reichenbachiella faecimaris]
MKKYFVTGIDTDSGKTVASAILVEKLKADYWKPIQAGEPTDSDAVRRMVGSDKVIHPEGIVLAAPMSPHAAAKLENIDLRADQLKVPVTENTLIIEGAGGLLVPINDDEFVINLARQFDAEVILVSRNYLGSINHTMLSISYLKDKGFNIAGIIFNDTPNPETERFILQYSQLPCLGRIEPLTTVDPSTIQSQLKNINL